MHIRIAMVAVCTLLLACSEKKTEIETANPESPANPATPEVHPKEGPGSDTKTTTNTPLKENDGVVGDQPKTLVAKETPKSEAPPVKAPKSNATPVAGTARIVVLIEHEALRSEIRQIDKFSKIMTKGKAVDDAPTTDEEKSHFAALLAGSATPLPANWASIETVFVVGVASPRVTRKGKQVSEGFTGIAMYMPPQLEPILSELSLAKSANSTDEFSKLVKAIYKESMNDK